MGNEGGYSNNPADPGGETMFGITQRVAEANGYTGAMKDLPRDTAKAIAKRQYWDTLHLDDINPRVAFQVFDANYNGGRAARWLQAAAGVDQDGVIGPATIAAVNNLDPLKIILRFDAYRLKYLTGIGAWPSFGKGWVNRIADNLMDAAS
jgi:lysozyme family protein